MIDLLHMAKILKGVGTKGEGTCLTFFKMMSFSPLDEEERAIY
jgi:hypothetical protein